MKTKKIKSLSDPEYPLVFQTCLIRNIFFLKRLLVFRALPVRSGKRPTRNASHPEDVLAETRQIQNTLDPKCALSRTCSIRVRSGTCPIRNAYNPECIWVASGGRKHLNNGGPMRGMHSCPASHYSLCSIRLSWQNFALSCSSASRVTPMLLVFLIQHSEC